MAITSVGEHQMIGNIGGRFYMNFSVMQSLAMAFGLGRKRFAEATEQVLGRLPDDVEIPMLPISRWGRSSARYCRPPCNQAAGGGQ